jgi:hypothetical protein
MCQTYTRISPSERYSLGVMYKGNGCLVVESVEHSQPGYATSNSQINLECVICRNENIYLIYVTIYLLDCEKCLHCDDTVDQAD